MPFGSICFSRRVFTSRLPPLSVIAWTLPATNSELTKTVPLSPWRIPRASSTSLAQTSALKPGGSFIFDTGSLSAGVGIGNAGTGAIFIAVSVPGRPLAQNGSSSFFASVCACAASGNPTSIVNRAASTGRLPRKESMFIGLLPGVFVVARFRTARPRRACASAVRGGRKA